MNLDDYQKQAYEFAVYPQEYKVTYPALGLCNEAGELCGKVKKWLRGDYEELPAEAIADELGDVLWYLAALCTDLGYRLSGCANRETFAGLEIKTEEQFDENEFIGKLAIELAWDCVEFSHDTNYVAVSTRDILSDIILLAFAIGIPTKTVAQRNLAKLRDRAVRGVIRGDGDDR